MDATNEYNVRPWLKAEHAAIVAMSSHIADELLKELLLLPALRSLSRVRDILDLKPLTATHRAICAQLAIDALEDAMAKRHEAEKLLALYCPDSRCGSSAEPDSALEYKRMRELRSLSELHAETEQNRIEFLRTDVALCLTFVDIARTELAMGEPGAAKRASGKAEQGYITITHFLPYIRKDEERQEIETKLIELRLALDSLRK